MMVIKTKAAGSGPSTRAFEVFAIDGFEARMTAIREDVRPWLESLGSTIGPALAEELGEPLFAHVARHARRTVNPPDDTWVAFGPDKRGYKKDRHFKLAISKNALRLLFEVGPEHSDKAGWAAEWRHAAGSLHSHLSNAHLAWFRNEHDESPAGEVDAIKTSDLAALADHLLSRRDGQLVLGRRLARAQALGLKGDGFADCVLTTFRALLPCYLLNQ